MYYVDFEYEEQCLIFDIHRFFVPLVSVIWTSVLNFGVIKETSSAPSEVKKRLAFLPWEPKKVFLYFLIV